MKRRAWATRRVGGFVDQWTETQTGCGTPKSVDGIVEELLSQSASRQFDASTQQIEAWEESVCVVGEALSEVASRVVEARDWSVLFEYSIPRREIRPDVVILGSGFVVPIEMKVGATTYSRADRLQAEDYGKDLEDFHEETSGLVVVPVLCATAAPLSDVDLAVRPSTSRVQLVNADRLGSVLTEVHSQFGTSHPINCDRWDQSRYRPTPGIVETALDVFGGQQVREISHAYADNLTATVDELRRVITQARERSERVVCFVTGVPGSGKTLAGLSAVHQITGDGDVNVLGTYLSGNGPLVDVLQYALARDLHDREGVKLRDAKHRASVMVQMVHRFVRELAESDHSPAENVIVFDEAQRAWDARQMKTKQRIAKSEAQITLEIMSRTQGWAVVVALVGEGQEINTGEAGIAEWTDALERFPEWMVQVSPHVFHQLGDRAVESPDLHLSVGVRAPRAQSLSDWVDALVEGRNTDASEALANNQDYPIYLSRDLEEMRSYLRDRASGDRRVGLLASAQARRLRAFGIEMSNDFQGGVHWPKWFVDGPDDVRSSYLLEVAASEFKCQGLEIDWAGLCWGSDFTRSVAGSEWVCRRVSGSRWVTEKDKTRAMNRYRVLLTRARYGMVIWVPEPSGHVPLVDAESLDATASFLLTCGVAPLAEAV